MHPFYQKPCSSNQKQKSSSRYGTRRSTHSSGINVALWDSFLAHKIVRFCIVPWLTSKAVMSSDGGKKMTQQQKQAIHRMREEGRVALVDGTFCHQCGIPIQQTVGRKQKQYCSDKCRMTWWNAHPKCQFSENGLIKASSAKKNC